MRTDGQVLFQTPNGDWESSRAVRAEGGKEWRVGRLLRREGGEVGEV